MEKSTDLKIFRNELNDGCVKNFSLADDLFFSRSDELFMSKIVGCDFAKSVKMAMLNNHNPLVFEECRFENVVEFDHTSFDKGLVFRNCQFNEEVNITDCTFNFELTFLNCKFNSALHITSSSADELNFGSGKFTEIRISGKLNSKRELGTVNFKDGNFDLVHIKCPEFNANLTLTGGEFDKFYIIDSVITGEIRADGSKLIIGSIVFLSCKLLSRIDLRNCIIQSFLKFSKVICLDELLISEHVFVQFIDLQGFTATERVHIAFQDSFNMLTLNDCDFKTSFECNSLAAEHVQLTSDFSAHFGGLLRGSIVFFDIPISDINLRCTNFGNLTFRDIDTSCIVISDFQNHNRVTFSNIQINPGKSSLNIVDSDLDKTLFLNVDCSKFGEVIVAKSDVSSVTFSNCILPTNILLGSSDPSMGYGIKYFEKANRSGYHRENYRQLKMAMEKQGNLSAALKYKAKEMHYLRRENSWSWDKILLYLNFFSNNHGLSWARALLFTMSITIILYFCYERTYTTPNYSLDSFFKYASSFPLYKNQTEEASKWATYLIIMLSRILIGYGIYQFIAAFRKFAHK